MDMMLEQFKTIFDRPEKVKKLREIILDLAVRGKLVPQNPNYEPASILLQRIKEEKEKLIKEKKIKKEKYNSNINVEDIIYEVPNGWERIRLGDISSVITKQTGFDYTKHIKPNLIEQKIDGYIPMIQTKNFKGSKFNYNTDYYLSMEIANKFPKIILKDKSLLFSIVGASIGNVGKYDSKQICIIGGAICKVDLINNIFMDYLYYFLQSPVGQYEIKKNYKSTAQGTITVQDVREIVVSMPPLEEQKRIVEKVDSLMNFCDKLENTLEKKVHYGELSTKSVFNAVGNVSTIEEFKEILRFILLNFKDLSLGDNAIKELKNCILQLAVQGKLVPQDSNDEPAEVLLAKIREEKERLIKEKKIKKEKPLGEIGEEEKPFKLPKGWAWTRVGKLGITQTGTTPSTKNEEYFNGTVPFIKPADISEKGINYENESLTELGLTKGRLILKNSVMMVCIGGSIGKNYYTSMDCSCNQQINAITPLANIDSKFVHYLLSNINVYNKILELSTGSATPIINKSKWEQIIIQLPPLKEQKRIVEKVDSLMKLCDELETKIKNQKDYSNRLMESIIKEV